MFVRLGARGEVARNAEGGLRRFNLLRNLTFLLVSRHRHPELDSGSSVRNAEIHCGRFRSLMLRRMPPWILTFVRMTEGVERTAKTLFPLTIAKKIFWSAAGAALAKT